MQARIVSRLTNHGGHQGQGWRHRACSSSSASYRSGSSAYFKPNLEYVVKPARPRLHFANHVGSDQQQPVPGRTPRLYFRVHGTPWTKDLDEGLRSVWNAEQSSSTDIWNRRTLLKSTFHRSTIATSKREPSDQLVTFAGLIVPWESLRVTKLATKKPVQCGLQRRIYRGVRYADDLYSNCE